MGGDAAADARPRSSPSSSSSSSCSSSSSASGPPPPPPPLLPPPPPAAAALLGGGFAVLETLAAGALAGLVAETLMHPLDTLSHRAKVHPRGAYGGSLLGAARLLAREEGARGFFAGLRATLAQGPPSTALYFLTYEAAKAAGLRATEGRHADLVFFASGAASELFASVVFVPLEVVKSRMQLGANPRRATGGVVAAEANFRTVREALAGIYAERGLAGLTAGWQAGFVQDVAFSATQFLIYENLKQAALDRRRRRRAAAAGGGAGEATPHASSLASSSSSSSPSSSSSLPSSASAAAEAAADEPALPTAETLLCGCVAGGVAAALTNPLDVITSRLMVQDGGAAGGGYGAGRGMAGVLAATLRDEGAAALWRGTLPRVAQVAPLSAIAFAVFEGMRGWFASAGFLRGAENPHAGIR